MRIDKRQILKVLNRDIVRDVSLATVLQIACFVMSVAVLTLGFWNLILFEPTAIQAVLGIVLSSLTSLVFIGIGLVLPNVAAMEGERPE